MNVNSSDVGIGFSEKKLSVLYQCLVKYMNFERKRNGCFVKLGTVDSNYSGGRYICVE